MKKKVNVLRAILAGLAVIIVNMVFGNLLYMNPLVAGLFDQFKGYIGIRSMEYFGGMGNWLILTLAFSLILDSFTIFIYIVLYNGIPSRGWKKGLIFGLLLGTLRAIPEAFNQWTLCNYPEPLILVQLINTLLGYLFFGFLIGLVFDKAKIIIREE